MTVPRPFDKFLRSVWGSVILLVAISLGASDVADIERRLDLPDFSFAGYHRSERPIPRVTGPIFNVIEYGAKPNDEKSDRAAIQRAIDAAGEAGGGVVLVPAGRFDLTQVSNAAPMVIRHNNIVIRGADPERSELHSREALAPPVPMRLWASPFVIQVEAPPHQAHDVAITGPAPRGATELKVAAGHGLSAGDWIVLALQNTDPDLLASELAGFEVIDRRWTHLHQAGVLASVRHQVESVEGNTLHLTSPIIKAVDPKNGWVVEPWFPLEEIGFEDLILSGDWQERFVHHRSWQDDGGHSMLHMSGVVNSWIRNCRFVDVNRAAFIGHSAQITVIDSEVQGTPGHSAIMFPHSTRCLMARVQDLAGQHHSLGISGQSMGNVLWRCYWHAHTSFESHAAQPRHTLFDSCTGGIMTGRAGGALVSLPNHLEGLILWNHHKTNSPLTDFVWENLNSTHWRILQPIIVGMHGTPIDFREGQSTVISLGKPIAEGSLYEFQVKRRLGKMPADLR